MRWDVHGERTVYESPWINLSLVDVEKPGDERFEHHVVRMPTAAVGVVVHEPGAGVLCLWRHRFITDTWGWELPAGRVEVGESYEEAAAREVLEETGWRPGPLTHLVSFHPTNGLSDQEFVVYRAAGADHLGEPSDPFESERIEWLPLGQLRDEAMRGNVRDGLSLVGVLRFLLEGA